MRLGPKIVALVVAVAALPISAGASAESVRSTEPPDRSISWLTIGDSYGAGEGASEAAGFCQRSPNAAGPKAATILRQELGWTIGPEVFAACTGYLAADVYNRRADLAAVGYSVFGRPVVADPANVDMNGTTSFRDWISSQGVPDGKFDVISVSLGGNDVGFADVITDCLYPPDIAKQAWADFSKSYTYDPGCDDSLFAEGGFSERIGALLDPSTSDGFAGPASASTDGEMLGSLQQLYQNIASELLAPDGVFIVMGYPRLITPSETWGRWRGNQCNMISRQDSDALGQSAVEFDQRLGDAVRGMGAQFEYLSRLQVFDDAGNYHSLCGRGVEWLNTPLLFLRDGTLRKERGFHPNDLGYLATAERLAGIVESRLGVQPLPPPTVAPPPEATSAPQPAATPPPTVRSGEAHYDVGDPFDAECTIAWPTAPSYGVDSIQMRTFCPGVPDQFLFVDIVYGDTELPVSPSRATMHVRGTIVDIIRSEYGYTVLAVQADTVEVL